MAESRSAADSSAQGIGATPQSASRTSLPNRAAATPTRANAHFSPVGRLQIRARVGLRDIEIDDDLVVVERDDVTVVLARQPVDLGDRQLAAARPHRCVEREQRGRRIGRVGRRRPVVAEDRVLAVLAVHREAAVAAVEVARKAHAPVPAAGRLAKVAADRPHRAQLGRRRRRARLAQRLRDLRIDLELGQRRPGADLRPVDPAGDEPADVDQRVDVDQPVLDDRDDVRPAGEQKPGRRFDLFEARRPQELHASSPSPSLLRAPSASPRG